MMLLGDLLKPVEARVSPPAQIDAASIDRFADPSGKQRGRIVLARDAREMVTRDEIVYIDLGAEDNLRAGDRLTVFRQAGKGRVVDYPEEITPTASGGFESDTFKGGKFSNKAQRMKKIDGEARGNYNPNDWRSRASTEFFSRLCGRKPCGGLPFQKSVASICVLSESVSPRLCGR
jgi:hypothetical protein